jgi:hypothetical protein
MEIRITQPAAGVNGRFESTFEPIAIDPSLVATYINLLSFVIHGRYQIANVLIFYNYEGSNTPKDKRVEMVAKDLKTIVK